MLVFTTRAGGACVMALHLMALSGCGDDTRLPETVSATAFATSTVAITQQGNADATIDTQSVSFKLDDSRSLVVHATLTSHATSMISVSARASMYDPGHSLSGPTPIGTIASALFEVTDQPTPP